MFNLLPILIHSFGEYQCEITADGKLFTYDEPHQMLSISVGLLISYVTLILLFYIGRRFSLFAIHSHGPYCEKKK